MPDEPPRPSQQTPGGTLEIERVYLLDRLPKLPDGAEVLHIQQGYLPETDEHDPSAAGDAVEGRIRRASGPRGVQCTLTVKQGLGLVRQEDEQTITEDQFQRLWPRTAGRRLSKTRYRLAGDPRTWEIDDFHDLDIVLAEVELPTADADVRIPDWLARHVVREVTEEPEFRSYSLAIRIGRASS